MSIVLLYDSAWPLICEWYAIVVRCLTTRKVCKFPKNLLVNYTPFNGEEIHRNAIGDKPKVGEMVCFVRGRRIGRMYHAC